MVYNCLNLHDIAICALTSLYIFDYTSILHEDFSHYKQLKNITLFIIVGIPYFRALWGYVWGGWDGKSRLHQTPEI